MLWRRALCICAVWGSTFGYGYEIGYGIWRPSWGMFTAFGSVGIMLWGMKVMWCAIIAGGIPLDMNVGGRRVSAVFFGRTEDCVGA